MARATPLTAVGDGLAEARVITNHCADGSCLGWSAVEARATTDSWCITCREEVRAAIAPERLLVFDVAEVGSQEWMIRFLEHRIGDRRIIRLIQKWLKAGVLEDGVVSVSEKGRGRVR